MGIPTGATVVYDDGTEETFEDVSLAEARADEGRVEYRYAYAADLLPGEPAGETGMWRYRALLPLEEGPIHYPLPVGGPRSWRLPGSGTGCRCHTSG